MSVGVVKPTDPFASMVDGDGLSASVPRAVQQQRLCHGFVGNAICLATVMRAHHEAANSAIVSALAQWHPRCRRVVGAVDCLAASAPAGEENNGGEP